MTDAPRRSSVGAVALGVAATTVYTLPLFLTGALAVELTGELAFGSAGLGIAVAVSRGSSAALSPVLGRLADRLGASRSIRASALIAGISSFGIATTAHGWPMLVFWLMVLGSAAAIGLPAGNRLLSNAVDPRRMGLAFGIKQSAPPTSSMLAGLSVPMIALTLGWRSAYLVAAGFALLVVFAAGRHAPRPQSKAEKPAGRPLEHRRLIWFLAAAFGLANAATSSVTTFYVDAAVEAGSSQRMAGFVLALASFAAIGVRIVAGLMTDRRTHGHLEMCTVLILAGSVGIIMLITGSPGLMAVGAVVALAGIWGFAGVFWFAIVRTNPRAPGKVSGTIWPLVLLGSTLGPTLFGVVADHSSYTVAWILSGCLALTAAATMRYAAKQLPVAASSSS